MGGGCNTCKHPRTRACNGDDLYCEGPYQILLHEGPRPLVLVREVTSKTYQIDNERLVSLVDILPEQGDHSLAVVVVKVGFVRR